MEYGTLTQMRRVTHTNLLFCVNFTKPLSDRFTSRKCSILKHLLNTKHHFIRYVLNKRSTINKVNDCALIVWNAKHP